MSIENLVVGATAKTVKGKSVRIVCVNARIDDGKHDVLALIDMGEYEFVEWYNATAGLDGELLHAIANKSGCRDIALATLEAPCSNQQK
ncbi:hypothetical protein VPHK469_0064 [Vibrio phage K469]